MKIVKFKRGRPGFTRTLRPIDLQQIGVKNAKETLEWTPGNNHQLILSNKLSESLVAALPKDFTVTDTEGDEPDESVDESSAGSSEDDPNSSEGDESDDDESSTPDSSGES